MFAPQQAGSNVQRIRTESQAFVSILKNESKVSKERVLVLKGTVEYNAKAVELICVLLLDSQVSCIVTRF